MPSTEILSLSSQPTPALSESYRPLPDRPTASLFVPVHASRISVLHSLLRDQMSLECPEPDSWPSSQVLNQAAEFPGKMTTRNLELNYCALVTGSGEGRRQLRMCFTTPLPFFFLGLTVSSPEVIGCCSLHSSLVGAIHQVLLADIHPVYRFPG